MSEPNAGSDVVSMKLKAKKQGRMIIKKVIYMVSLLCCSLPGCICKSTEKYVKSSKKKDHNCSSIDINVTKGLLGRQHCMFNVCPLA